MTNKQLLKLLDKLIKEIEKNWTKDKCKGYAPGCANCQGQLLLGLLEDYKSLIKWEREYSPEMKHEGKKKCKHEALFGALGAPYYSCLDCDEDVYNPEWKHDREALKKTKIGKDYKGEEGELYKIAYDEGEDK